MPDYANKVRGADLVIFIGTSLRIIHPHQDMMNEIFELDKNKRPKKVVCINPDSIQTEIDF